MSQPQDLLTAVMSKNISYIECRAVFTFELQYSVVRTSTG